MALTKKHEAIRAAKAELRNQILAAYAEGEKATKKVPDVVLCGKQQVAIAWKETAAKFHDPECPLGPKAASLQKLTELLTLVKKQADQLCGKAPLL